MKLNIKNNKPLKPALQVVDILKINGFKAFLVGGGVRNLLLKRVTDNFDIATDALPNEVEKILQSNGHKTKNVGKKFGTIYTLVYGCVVEITTFRAESRYSDRRHPDAVEFVKDYKLDAKRRDFTINALYLDCESGEILDPEKGLNDLDAKLVRFVGKATKRIDEDALRMLRGVRLSAQLGFKLEKNSYAAIKTRAKYLQGISGERIKAELDIILNSTGRVAGLRLLDQIGLLRFIIPDFHKLKKLTHGSKRYHLEGDVFEHTILTLDYVTDLSTTYAAIFHDYGKNYTGKKVFREGEWVTKFHGHQKSSADSFKNFAERLKFSSKDKRNIYWLILHHDDRLIFRNMNLNKQLQYALQPNFSKLLEIWKADSMANLKADEQGNHYTRPSESYTTGLSMVRKLEKKADLIKKFASGDVIMQLTGQRPGPKIQHIRSQIIEQIYLGKINNQADLKNHLLLGH